MDIAELINLPYGTAIETWHEGVGRIFIKKVDDAFLIVEIRATREWVPTSSNVWDAKNVIAESNEGLVTHGIIEDFDTM